MRLLTLSILSFSLVVLFPALAAAQGDGGMLDEFVSLITLQDYNTRIVLIGTSLLGFASGIVGTFLLLRKRSLLTDAVSHATLPGVCLAFMILVALGQEQKSLLVLLLGATITGLIGMFCVLLIQTTGRLKADAALAIVLGVFFGFGLLLMGYASRMESGNAAGLQSFVYGKTASMLLSDAILIGGTAFASVLISVVFFKEFKAICFDANFARSQGWPVTTIDILLMSLIVVLTVIGLQSVGLILVVALLITPAAAARFWSDDLGKMAAIASVVGGLSGLFGAALSSLLEDMPAGAVIVLTASVLFFGSLVFGTSKGIVPRFVRQHLLSRRIVEQHLLRALFELDEAVGKPREPHSVSTIQSKRSWSPKSLRRQIRRSLRRGLVRMTANDCIALTEAGESQARRVIRNHRLWELYLITHADIAPSHVDRDADSIEHVLDEAMIERLEAMLTVPVGPGTVPTDPHAQTS